MGLPPCALARGSPSPSWRCPGTRRANWSSICPRAATVSRLRVPSAGLRRLPGSPSTMAPRAAIPISCACCPQAQVTTLLRYPIPVERNWQALAATTRWKPALGQMSCAAARAMIVSPGMAAMTPICSIWVTVRMLSPTRALQGRLRAMCCALARVSCPARSASSRPARATSCSASPGRRTGSRSRTCSLLRMAGSTTASSASNSPTGRSGTLPSC